MDWYDWDESAFEAARTTRRPVLLFIGAAWCRWSKELEREVLSSPEISSLITERFIAVRVDKDKRPAWSARSADIADFFAPLPAAEEWQPLAR